MAARRHHYTIEGQMRLGLPTRSPVLRLHSDDDLIVDNFAGGGGASLGIKWAMGRDPDIAVNHDPEAIAMHAANHPRTMHYCGNVWDVNPAEVVAGKRVALAWFSPDCTHHSKCKGTKPLSSRRRALAWVVVRWARAVKPRVIVLENVEEFEDWGPLDSEDRPDPKKRGLTFRIWLGKLQAAGYKVEWRQLRACDFGAPTTRKRLFIIARSDGEPIVWPEETFGPGCESPHRTAAECIEWAIPAKSIFGRAKPLAEKTLARIGRGVWKYILDAADPFVVARDKADLIAPSLIQRSWGERQGQLPRCLDIRAPLGTVVAGGIKHGLACAFLAKHYGGGTHENNGTSMRRPIDTITTKDHHALVSAAVAPIDTRDEVRAFLLRYNRTGRGNSLAEPMPTLTTKHRFGIVTVRGVDYSIVDIGMRMLVPRELFRAQGFPDSYVIEPEYKGEPLPITAQVKMCGNSVSPTVARAIVAANLGPTFGRRATVAA